MMEAVLYDVSCHCGAVRQKVASLSQSAAADHAPLSICHCWSCRHTTGVLCTSYVRITHAVSLEATTAYSTSSATSRYFCSTCGCHCFLRKHADGMEEEWMVASGIISGELPSIETQAVPELQVKHNHVDSTTDGGLAIWMPGTGPTSHESTSPANRELSVSTSLSARCHCNNVSFRITRPDSTSKLPKSYFPDLMIPYKEKSPRAANPDDDKWWLRGNNRYLAGTCACKSCRLISGFEIQTWVFVPRSNIYFQDTPLEFPVKGVLRSYQSSSVVTREFCPRCGATVFWHDTLRPDLIDVSVGLLSANGARAEDWLDWWRERVSFAEESRVGRWGCVAQTADALVQALENGMKEKPQGSK